ncbi:MAG: hypothetical protein ACYTFI_05610, partial [Planctomycetota bacterium]
MGTAASRRRATPGLGLLLLIGSHQMLGCGGPVAALPEAMGRRTSSGKEGRVVRESGDAVRGSAGPSAKEAVTLKAIMIAEGGKPEEAVRFVEQHADVVPAGGT